MRRLAAISLVFFYSAPAPGADLLEIYREALKSDAVYASARATWAAGQEKLPQGRAGLLPQVTFSASTQHNDRDILFRTPGAVESSRTFNSNSVTLSLTQPIYRAQNIVQYEQAKTQVLSADIQFALSAQDLILRVSQAYLDVLLAQTELEVFSSQKTAISEQLAQAKRNFEVGTSTITDTHEAQARYDLAVSQEIAARNNLEIRKRAVEQIIGKSAPPLALLGKNFVLSLPEPNSMEQWVAEAGKSNLQVLVSQSLLTFASQEVSRNRGAHLPTLDAVASYSDSGTGSGVQGSSGNDITSRIIGLQLAVPIYQGGLPSSRVREALANQDRVRQELETARRTAEFSTRQAFLGVTNGVAQINALQAALISSHSSLDSTRLGLEVGVRTQVDVLNAQQQVFSTRRDMAQATYNYTLSLLRLKAAVGRLAEEDLVKVNAWLDRK